jgi:hypothetical protein
MAKWNEDVIQRKSAEFEQIAAKFKGHSLQELEASYFEARGRKDELAAELKPVDQCIMVLEALIAEKFAEDDLKTVSFDNGNRITVSFERPRSVADREALINWIKANGYEHELNLNYQSMNRLCKELAQEGKPLPDGVVEGEPLPKITYTRRKG